VPKFEAIDLARVFSKFHVDFFEANSQQIQEFTKLSVNNLRSNIAKNELIFLHELVASPRTEKLSGFITEVFPSVMHKVAFEKAFIANLCKKIITKAVSNCKFISLMRVLVDGCTEKNFNISEFACASLLTFVKEFQG
jgi:hypothetical protein